jgi:hypothetical protein
MGTCDFDDIWNRRMMSHSTDGFDGEYDCEITMWALQKLMIVWMRYHTNFTSTPTIPDMGKA